MRCLWASAVALSLALLPSFSAARPPRTVPAGYTETLLASSLARPVALTWLPGGRLLIGEQYTGVIKLFKNGAVQPTPFATISPVNTNNNETGLVGICTDPNFAANGFVYVFVTQTTTIQRVWRITTGGLNFSGDTGTVGGSPLIDNIPTNNVNHNGGGIGFGPDGKIYLSVGENAVAADSQNAASWRGKILRFNPDGSIPSDNPTLGSAVYCIGLRNPFRVFWRPSNGSMFCTENGPSVDDEINKILPLANYGWPNDTGVNTNPAYTNPIYTFAATIAICDALFYTGSTMPLTGEMLFCDYKTNKVRRFTLDGSDAVSAGPTDFWTALPTAPVDIEQGPDGALYVCCIGPSNGTLHKVQATGTGNFAPVASFTAAPTSGPSPLLVNVNAAASYDPDGSIASYSWNWGDGSPASSGVAPSHSYAADGSDTVTLTVTDNLAATGVATQSVVVASGNLPPSAHIESATPNSGNPPLNVQFTGHGHDDANGLLHTWDFGDGSPTQSFPGMNSDINSAPLHVYATDGTYTCTLTITDAGALTGSHTTQIVVGTGVTPGSGGGRKKRCGLLGIEGLLVLALRRRRR